MSPESAEDFYARIAAATDTDGRLPVAVEEMPGWDIYPYEVDSLRLKPLRPLADAEPARAGEDPAECWCADGTWGEWHEPYAWGNDRWRLTMMRETGLPVMFSLTPLVHCDLPTVPMELAAEMGQLIVAISAAVEELPSVGRVQIAKWGDGGAHLHLAFLGRPERILQFRGSPLLDWEENLPRVPLEILRANATFVAERVIMAVGGDGPAW
jgi:hypothetical protein